MRFDLGYVLTGEQHLMVERIARGDSFDALTAVAGDDAYAVAPGCKLDQRFHDSRKRRGVGTGLHFEAFDDIHGFTFKGGSALLFILQSLAACGHHFQDIGGLTQDRRPQVPTSDEIDDGLAHGGKINAGRHQRSVEIKDYGADGFEAVPRNALWQASNITTLMIHERFPVITGSNDRRS